MLPMSMYSDILSSALDDWEGEMTRTALVEYVLRCRAEMLDAGTQRGDTAYRSLARELAYDRALMKLCEASGVAVTVTNFASPHQERARLESELAKAGTDLVGLARRPGDD
jgi:hypothetical protein